MYTVPVKKAGKRTGVKQHWKGGQTDRKWMVSIPFSSPAGRDHLPIHIASWHMLYSYTHLSMATRQPR